MFYVVYFAGVGNRHLAKGPFDTVSEAAEKRDVSGDLVCRKVDNEFEVVTDDDSWLFDWEWDDPDSYASRKFSHRDDLAREFNIVKKEEL